MQATVLNVNELSTMFPMVSLRVRIIELKDAEPNNLSNGQVIRDSKGHPTQKLQMIVRDATGGVRITFWKVTEEAVRAFRVGTCALFFNVKVARAQSPKYSDYHWISVNADPTGSMHCIINAMYSLTGAWSRNILDLGNGGWVWYS